MKKPVFLSVKMEFQVPMGPDLIEFLEGELEVAEEGGEGPTLQDIEQALDDKLNGGEVNWDTFLEGVYRMKIDVEAPLES